MSFHFSMAQFTKVRMCGQHPDMMSRVGWGVIFMSLVFYMFQSILSILFFALLCLEKLIILTDGGYPPICGSYYFYFLTLPLVAIHKEVDMDLGLVRQSLCTAMEGWSLGLFIFSVS